MQRQQINEIVKREETARLQACIANGTHIVSESHVC